MNIIVSAGGSGGHIYPALAIIEEFEKREKNLNVLYIGTHNRMEKDIVPKKGIRYESLEVYGFTKDIKRDIKNIFLINKAIKKSIKLMQEFKPDVVIGVGGYVTYPVLKAAKKLNIKTFIHEQNSRPGKVNYLTSRYANLVGVTFKSSIPFFKSAKKVIYTGHPSLDKASNTIPIPKNTLGVNPSKPLVVIVAGSLGSSSLSNKLLDFLNSDLHEAYEILYICGNNVNIDSLKSKVNKQNVHFVPYVDNLPGIIASSNLVISRAGAGSLFEIIGVEKPSIIIPSPNVANNHQYYNALELSEAGAIVLMEEETLESKTLAKEINELLNNQEKINELKKNMADYKKIKPLDTIYQNIKELTSK
jgi:UDP-N-acetylglucosamine--N-acetylmuramyl-(pentapeptide) pyrophosphoryl-undecaprenol N-acetylglucosamine transferase